MHETHELLLISPMMSGELMRDDHEARWRPSQTGATRVARDGQGGHTQYMCCDSEMGTGGGQRNAYHRGSAAGRVMTRKNKTNRGHGRPSQLSGGR